MNRRKVLQGLAALPIMAAFAGCPSKLHDKDKDGKSENHTGPSKVRTLRLYLNGPFAVVLQKDKNYRIKAYVPYDEAHEFRFQTLLVPEKKYKAYQFTLDEESVEPSSQPYIDHGFDGFNVELAQWKAPSDSFISLDLPAPRVISYMTPLEPVQFEASPEFPYGQFASLPMNHVLEYRVKEGCKVVLHSNQLDDCTPLTCDDLHEQYMRLWQEMDAPENTGPNPPPTHQVLTRCSQSDVCTLFLGVGLPPRKFDAAYTRNHALKFFNNKLLPSLYGSEIPQGKRIVRLDTSPCASSSELATSPMLAPAMQRLPFPRARYLQVASTEDCTAPCVTATAHRS